MIHPSFSDSISPQTRWNYSSLTNSSVLIWRSGYLELCPGRICFSGRKAMKTSLRAKALDNKALIRLKLTKSLKGAKVVWGERLHRSMCTHWTNICLRHPLPNVLHLFGFIVREKKTVKIMLNALGSYLSFPFCLKLLLNFHFFQSNSESNETSCGKFE